MFICLTVLASPHSLLGQDVKPGELFPIRHNGKYGFIDKSGKLIIKQQFGEAFSFSEGLAPVKINGRWGYVNDRGKIVIKPRFELADLFYEGLARVKINNKWGFISTAGKIVIQA